ncbi:MAG TPA: endonuclease III [Thermomicrobiaceae bacterium]|nr:endonuclease III [Thermomicrobiaceae bacterium]
MIGDAAPGEAGASPQIVLRRLETVYGRPVWIPTLDPLEQLIQTVLSQHTSDVNADHAYRSLRARYPDWEAMRLAPIEQIAESIRSGGLADRKAATIHGILNRLFADWEDPSLISLAHLPLETAKARLTSLPGVGPKTAACVLMFALGKPALPVDTHVYRVSRRLGLIESSISPEAAHSRLESRLDPADVYSFHVGMITHGRRVCHARQPHCEVCVLNDICRYYLNRGQLESNETSN